MHLVPSGAIWHLLHVPEVPTLDVDRNDALALVSNSVPDGLQSIIVIFRFRIGRGQRGRPRTARPNTFVSGAGMRCMVGGGVGG